MKRLVKLTMAITIMCIFTNAQAQKLDYFGSSVSQKIGPKTIRAPYTDVVTYLGYAAVDTEDEIKDGKKYYYIYMWIPVAAPELGVRMMSPAGITKNKNIIESEDYINNKGSKDYFDTYITLERSSIVTKSGITKEGVDKAIWYKLASNDDSSEMPKNAGKKRHNSLLRYESHISDPLKALTVGLYRIGFTSYKKGEVKGTFLAEIASPIKLNGVSMARTIDELVEQINK